MKCEQKINRDKKPVAYLNLISQHFRGESIKKTFNS